MLPRNAWPLLLVLPFLAGAALPAGAQLSDNLGALTGDNARGYLQPLPKALSGTLNSAVFQSGYVARNTFTFSLGVRVMSVAFDDADRTYTPTPPSYFTPIETVRAPTVIGSTESVTQQGANGSVLPHPGGFDISKFMLAVPQLSIGSLFGTRGIVRWASADLGDADLGKLDFLGVGAQHSISQYFHGLPVDVAAGFFYQKLKISSGLIDTKSWLANVTASKRIAFMEPYVGVGYESFTMNASYTDDTNPENNYSVDFDTLTNGRLTAGFQLLLAFTRFQAEANFGAETGVAVGLSLGRY